MYFYKHNPIQTTLMCVLLQIIINQDHQELMKEDNIQLLSEQLLIDMEGLMKDMEQVDQHLAFENIPEKVILLLGQTKAGKTTLMYYLLGKKLIREKDESMGLFYMKPEAKIFDAQIGNNYDSTTVYPNIPTELGEDDVLIIDMPGFSDTRYRYRLLNIYIIREVIKKIRSVHVSLVISNQFFDGKSMGSILERNCRLLNKELLASPGCFSFILTKIEDKQAQLEQFEESLRELEENAGILQEIETIKQAKIYTFQNNSPRVEEGVELKLKIISENKFYKTNELPDNLLSQQYADVILGQDIQEDFYDFIVEMLAGMERTLSQAICLFLEAVKYHHAAELTQLFDCSTDGLADSIASIASNLKIGEISSLRIDLNEPFNQPQDTIRFLNLTKKFYRIDEKPFEEGSIEAMSAALESFIEWSKLFEAEQSSVSKELREKIHKIFKFCSSCLKTVTYIKSAKVSEQCHYLCRSSPVITAIAQYRSFATQSDMLPRIANHERISRQLSQNEEFKEILIAFFPSLGIEDGEEVIEKVRVRGKIKNKKMDAALIETMKDTSRPVPKEQRFVNINITEMTKDTIGTIRNMPIGSNYLKIVVRLAFKFQSELINTDDPIKIEFGLALMNKAASILQRLGMLEIAILFYLAAASELQAERLINTGICFKELSQNFIKSTLVPYYSEWNPNFQMVENLYNYLSIHATDINTILSNEKEMVRTFERMHQIDYQDLSVLKRFEFAFIESFSQDRHLFDMLQQAERAESLLKASRMTGLKKQLQSLTSI